MPNENLTHKAQVFNSQMNSLVPEVTEESESENVTHRAKILDAQLKTLAPDVSSITPSDENITERAKAFNQFMEYFVNSPGPGPSPSTGSDVLVPPEFPVPDVTLTVT